MGDEAFTHDVFLSHSAKAKAVVRASSLSASTGERAVVRCRNSHLAERLRQDGPHPKAECRRQKAEILHSAFFIHPFLCAFGSDWAQLEAGTFRFLDPLNQERRFIPLRLDKAPIRGPLAQFFYIN